MREWGSGGVEIGLRLAPGGEAATASARIEKLLAFVRRRLRGFDISTRTDAWIREVARDERRKRVTVKAFSLGLHVLLVPVEAKPLEISNCVNCRAWLVLRMVEILHAEDYLAAKRPRTKPGNHESAHVPEMQGTSRTRRKPADVLHCSFQYLAHSLTKSLMLSSVLNAAAVAFRMSFVLISAAT